MRTPILRCTLLVSAVVLTACGSAPPTPAQGPPVERPRARPQPTEKQGDTGPPASDIRVPSPISTLRIGMTEAQAESALGVVGGPHSHCHGYGDYEVKALCIALPYKHGVLNAVVLLFDSTEEAHKEITGPWGPSLQKGNKELWLTAPGATPPMQAWLYPFGEGARLEL